MKKLIVLIIAMIMVASMIPVTAISASAAGDGMWTTYRHAQRYPTIDNVTDTERVYPPEP